MMQEDGRRTGDPSYASLLEPLLRDLDPLVAEIVRDVAGPGDDVAEVEAASRRAAETTIRRLLASAAPDAADDERLRREGARSARAGEPLRHLLDRYLTAGWVVWEAATHEAPEDREALALLGTALLKAGDAAAAALADGHAEAERELAARAASARREFVDALLDLPVGGPAQARRTLERAPQFGLDATAAYRVVMIALGRDLADEAPEVDAIARALVRPRRGAEPTGVIVATRRGRLVVVVRDGSRAFGDLPSTLGRLLEGTAWVAVASGRSDGLSGVGVAAAEATASLEVAERVGRRGLIPADDVLLERVLLADPSLTAAAVAHELAPLLGAGRGAADLVETLAVYLASGQGIRATARCLGIAPRTVAYRLERAETLLGGPIEGDRALRLATVLFARRVTAPLRG